MYNTISLSKLLNIIFYKFCRLYRFQFGKTWLAERIYITLQSDSCCSCSHVLQSYKTSISKILGILQIFIGISCIGLQIGALVHYGAAWSAIFMQGIWCGPFVSFSKPSTYNFDSEFTLDFLKCKIILWLKTEADVQFQPSQQFSSFRKFQR